MSVAHAVIKTMLRNDGVGHALTIAAMFGATLMIAMLVALLREPVHTALEQLWVWWATDVYHWISPQ